MNPLKRRFIAILQSIFMLFGQGVTTSQHEMPKQMSTTTERNIDDLDDNTIQNDDINKAFSEFNSLYEWSNDINDVYRESNDQEYLLKELLKSLQQIDHDQELFDPNGNKKREMIEAFILINETGIKNVKGLGKYSNNYIVPGSDSLDISSENPYLRPNGKSGYYFFNYNYFVKDIIKIIINDFIFALQYASPGLSVSVNYEIDDLMGDDVSRSYQEIMDILGGNQFKIKQISIFNKDDKVISPNISEQLKEKINQLTSLSPKEFVDRFPQILLASQAQLDDTIMNKFNYKSDNSNKHIPNNDMDSAVAYEGERILSAEFIASLVKDGTLDLNEYIQELRDSILRTESGHTLYTDDKDNQAFTKEGYTNMDFVAISKALLTEDLSKNDDGKYCLPKGYSIDKNNIFLDGIDSDGKPVVNIWKIKHELAILFMKTLSKNMEANGFSINSHLAIDERDIKNDPFSSRYLVESETGFKENKGIQTNDGIPIDYIIERVFRGIFYSTNSKEMGAAEMAVLIAQQIDRDPIFKERIQNVINNLTREDPKLQASMEEKFKYDLLINYGIDLNNIGNRSDTEDYTISDEKLDNILEEQKANNAVRKYGECILSAEYISYLIKINKLSIDSVIDNLDKSYEQEDDSTRQNSEYIDKIKSDGREIAKALIKYDLINLGQGKYALPPEATLKNTNEYLTIDEDGNKIVDILGLKIDSEEILRKVSEKQLNENGINSVYTNIYFDPQEIPNSPEYSSPDMLDPEYLKGSSTRLRFNYKDGTSSDDLKITSDNYPYYWDDILNSEFKTIFNSTTGQDLGYSVLTAYLYNELASDSDYSKVLRSYLNFFPDILEPYEDTILARFRAEHSNGINPTSSKKSARDKFMAYIAGPVKLQQPNLSEKEKLQKALNDLHFKKSYGSFTLDGVSQEPGDR